MAKRIVQMSIDPEVILKIKKVVSNTSGLVERLLKNYLSSSSEYTEEKDMVILEKKLELARKERGRYAIQEKKLTQQVDNIKKAAEEAEIQRLEAQKLEEARLKSCLICGGLISKGVKYELFKAGRVHVSCFLSADKSKRNQLMEGGDVNG